MDEKLIKNILESVQSNELSIDDAITKLRHLPYEDLGFVNIDHHRSLRQGFAECIWGKEKTAEQIITIIKRMMDKEHSIIVTRVDQEKAEYIIQAIPAIEYHVLPKMLTFSPQKIEVAGKGVIMVICAGTSDIPVAEEAVITARMMGNRVETLYDVGVAGLHRLVSQMEKLNQARVFIVVAGMEGALPSVVGGLVSKPVIAVPTSIGYGANFGGIAALLGMLNSCASGVAVVNIDNGFGAGFVGSLINRL
jgi:pyridinium-3,5-biscarboxylic acid mononucleotide synthase